MPDSFTLQKKGFVLGRKLDELRGGRALRKLNCEFRSATSHPLLVAKTTSLQLHGLCLPKIPRGRGHTHLTDVQRYPTSPEKLVLKEYTPDTSLHELPHYLVSVFSAPPPSYQSCFSTKSQGVAGTAIFLLQLGRHAVPKLGLKQYREQTTAEEPQLSKDFCSPQLLFA